MAVGKEIPVKKFRPNSDPLWNVVRILSTDYAEYGGRVVRWQEEMGEYPDCSAGCRHFQAIDADWGVCLGADSPRAGLLTFEHQAGYNCFEQGERS